MAINNQVAVATLAEKFKDVGHLYSAYSDAKAKSMELKKKYDEEMAETQVKKTNVDNAKKLKTLRETELKIAE
jgi:hypothetical protein